MVESRMNLLDVRTLYNGLRRSSLTLSLLVGAALLGVSGSGTLRGWLKEAGIAWWLALVLPFVIIALLSKWEMRLPLREKLRHWLALGIVICAAALARLLGYYEEWLTKDLPPPPPTAVEEFEKRGPRNR